MTQDFAPSTIAPRAVGYFRISRDRDDMMAPDLYRDRLASEAGRLGLNLVTTFSDIDVSGGVPAMNRLGWGALWAKRSDFDVILVPSLDRLSRDTADGLQTMKAIRAAGLEVLFLDSGTMDTGAPEGEMSATVVLAMATMHRKNIGRTWGRVVDRILKEGRTNGPLSFGYDYDPATKKTTVNEAEAAIVREVFDRYLSGESIRSIYTDMDARAIPKKKGGGWFPESVRDILKNPAYVAIIRYKGQTFPAAWEPIIDREVWDAVQVLREAQRARSRESGNRTGKGNHLLSGLLFCDRCGGAYNFHPGSRPSSHSYVCRASTYKRCDGGGISAQKVEREVTAAFLQRLRGPVKASAQGLKKSDFPKPQTDDRAKSLAKIERRLDAAIDAMLDGSPSLRDRLKAKVHDLEAERQTIVDAMNITAADTIRTDRRSEDLAKLREAVSDIDRAWEAATIEERKAMLRLAIDRVRVIGTGRGKTIAIDWASGV